MSSFASSESEQTELASLTNTGEGMLKNVFFLTKKRQFIDRFSRVIVYLFIYFLFYFYAEMSSRGITQWENFGWK